MADARAESSKRLRLIVNLLFVVVILFVGRLFYLQIIKHQDYVALANSEQLKSLIIPAKRGEIFAMNRSEVAPLVMNESVYTVFIDPEVATKKNEIIEAVRKIAGGNARPHLEELVNVPKSRYQILAKGLTHRQAEKLKDYNFSGLGFQEESQRVYPEGKLAAQVLGFVNAEGVGNYGIEGAFNKELSGKDGRLRTVTDVRDVPLTIGSQNITEPAIDGDNIVLSIDRNIQHQAEKELASGLKRIKATDGSILVMNPSNGQVLAMANLPSYDPADFGKVKSAAQYNNAVISDPYEPASVIKTFTLATGIDKGVITPKSTYQNTGSIRVDDIVVQNALQGLNGTLSMQDVLNNSLNTGTVTIAQKLGDGKSINREARDTLYSYFYNRFHLGQLTGVELANESPGLIIPPTELQGNAVRYSNMTFGQGLDITMIQVAAGFSAVVNGGNYYDPSVVAGSLVDDEFIEKEATKPRRVIKPSTSKDVTNMLMDARRSVSWMGGKDKKGYRIGGKTGTAETLRDGRYIKTETIGTYIGYGGGDKAEYVIMVRVAAPNRNLEGGLHAEPIFAGMSNWMIDYLRIPPERK